MAAWWPSIADEKLSASNRGPGMPTIVFASSKGGAGKSTSAVLLATQLAERGAEVTLIDADPRDGFGAPPQRRIRNG